MKPIPPVRLYLWLACILLSFPAGGLAANSPCASKTYEGEQAIAKGDFGAAQKALEAAMPLCSQPSEHKSARPAIALGKVYMHFERYRDAVTQFEDALTREPGLPLAFMNLGAAYTELGEYQKAVEVSKKALKTTDSKELARVNFNIGLAYFKMAADMNDTTDRRAEPYFKKSSELDPAIAGNYYYLGVFKEIHDQKYPEAKALYKKACDLRYPPACNFLQNFDQRIASYGPKNPEPAAPAKNMNLPKDEATLYREIAKKYSQLGVDAKAVEGVIANLKKSYASFPPDQRVSYLRDFLQAMH